MLFATAVGLTVGGKFLIGLGVAGSAILGGLLGATFNSWYNDHDNDSDDEGEKVERTYKRRKKKKEKYFDGVINQTHQDTTHLRQRNHTHTNQMKQSTTVLATGSAVWNQEGQQLQQLIGQLRAVIGERERQLEQIVSQLQPQVNGFANVSNEFAQSQWLLAERQNDLLAIINLLRPILQQLEARNNDWGHMVQRIQKLESTSSTNERVIAKAEKRHTELVSEVTRLHNELTKAMSAISQLEATKKAYRDQLEAISASQQTNGTSQHSHQAPNTMRFFN